MSTLSLEGPVQPYAVHEAESGTAIFGCPPLTCLSVCSARFPKRAPCRETLRRQARRSAVRRRKHSLPSGAHPASHGRASAVRAGVAHPVLRWHAALGRAKVLLDLDRCGGYNKTEKGMTRQC